ncbi:MAG: DUF4079 family protein [Myxococcota bacterium]
MASWWWWIHPVVGIAAVAGILWLGTMGVRSRHRKPYAGESRARHRRWSRGVLALCVGAAILGTASVRFARPELELSRSLHFWLGWSTAGLMVALALTGPKIHGDPDSKRIHPPTGIFVLLLATATATFGMSLLP